MEVMSEKKGLNALHLKIIAIVCMTIDHIAWLFVPQGTMASFYLHVLGRITFPVMAFFVSEGYKHTSDVKKYAIRLAIFAAISAFPYYFAFGSFGNVYITLLLGLLSLILTENVESGELRLIIVMLCSILSYFGDWGVVGVPLIYLFGRIKDESKRIVVSTAVFVAIYIANTLITSLLDNAHIPIEKYSIVGVFIAALLLLYYNGQRGKDNSFTKYIFYWYYPVHLLVLGAIAKLI